jgi:hypothetical protein
MRASLRQTVIIVAVLNFAYFGIEFSVALAIGSVSLFADSVDFQDTSVNLLIALRFANSSIVVRSAGARELPLMIGATCLIASRLPCHSVSSVSAIACRYGLS